MIRIDDIKKLENVFNELNGTWREFNGTRILFILYISIKSEFFQFKNTINIVLFSFIFSLKLLLLNIF